MKQYCDMKMFWSITVGSKWQIVIPKDVRNLLSIKEGDQLFVVTKFDKAIGIFKTDDIEQFVAQMQAEMESKTSI